MRTDTQGGNTTTKSNHLKVLHSKVLSLYFYITGLSLLMYQSVAAGQKRALIGE